jgi:protein gp37
MGKDSSIEWTHHTFNPWWGCVRVSPGCEHCYAETFSKRVGKDVWGVSADRRFFGDKHWGEPLKWNRDAEKAGERRRVFCASMADVFEDRPDLVEWRARLYELTTRTPHLDWLLLTKRIENADRLWATAHVDAYDGSESLGPTWKQNVWLGTTVEDRKRADRLSNLVRTRAAVKFISAEPLLECVNISLWLRSRILETMDGQLMHNTEPGAASMGGIWHTGVDWVICGGESGHGARPMHPDWARSLRDQCNRAGVPFLFKQWGVWGEVPYDHDNPPGDKPSERYVNIAGGHGFHGESVVRISSKGGKKAQGRLLDGRTWDEYPVVK